MDMSCFLLPTQPPMLKLAFLPRLVIGYTPTYPATNAQATTTAQPRIFPRQPALALPSLANGTFRPTLTAGASLTGNTLGGAANTVALPAAFNPGLTITPHFKPTFKPGFNKADSPAKGLKRKAEDSGSINGDTNGKVDTSLYPLYCKVCRVTLNAPAQAKQHYEGKNHAKKLKMSADGKEEEKSGDSTNEQPSSTTNGTAPAAEIKAEVYCKICGVSFNSPKQAQQHYQGKNHAKKVRATNHANNNHVLCRHHDPANHKGNSKYSCRTCHGKSSTTEVLELAGLRQNSRNTITERSSAVLRGRWQQKGGVGHTVISNGDINGGLRLPGFISGSPSPPAPSGVPANGITLLSSLPNVISSTLSTTLPNAIFSNLNKRTKRDFSMYRTPSGKYYCSTCNVTLNSEPQFAQHMESKKHKASQSSSRRNSDPSTGPVTVNSTGPVTVISEAS